jgi:membrane-associated phospholipid phosphatase
MMAASASAEEPSRRGRLSLPGIATVTGKYLAGTACVLICALLYLPLNRYPLFEPRELPLTFIDRAVPFWPVTGWIYVATFAFLLWAFVSTRDLESAARFLYACMFVQTIAALCFYLYPITFPRHLYPISSDASYPSATITAFQRSIDQPTNCLPSLHVTTDLLCVALIGRRRRRAFLLSIPLAVLLSLSILTFKQHYFVDALAGLALGLLAYGVFFRWKGLRIDVRAAAARER